MTKRQDVGKKQGGIFQRLGNWVAGTKPPTTEQGYTQEGHTVSSWSSTFDDTPLDGDRIVDGTHCKTVGEYKAACAKFYDPV